MKQIFSLVMAGIIGGLITLGGARLMAPETPVQVNQPAMVQQVKNLNVPAGTSAGPFDFKMAANKATPAVVHISAAAGTPAYCQ